ncbi:microtubule-associated protein futsch-like isoform X2 [Mya arenaria]|uniref:microtubule-associated protein futsch-like isoform X2 n=1 Tax=Mya arenaria TaxID=6604 RepID=UPI0022E89754|nr:microtubule-associated protein futsch-like isoform X2 [Mya arenaria]
MDLASNGGGDETQTIAMKGAAVLLVIGEPFSEEHRTLILSDLSKGFRSWDVEGTGVDINDELAHIANRADLGEQGPDGERVIRHSSEQVSVEILVNPQAQTVSLGVKAFLTTPSKHKHLIYAGHAFQGSGAWILQDDTFTYGNFAQAFKDQDVNNAMKQQQGSTLHIYTNAEGEWSNGHISKSDFAKQLNVKLNPTDKLDNSHGVLQFSAYVSNFIKVRQLNELLQSSDVVGNIRFSRPTLYIFPGCQGDSALFGINGFNLLVNGGYSRKACFWDFTRHLDRIDAALMTHLGADNLYGFKSVLQRKSIENIHPEIGFMYVNGSDKVKTPTEGEGNEKKEETLQINLAEEGNQIIQFAKQMGQAPQACSRSLSGQSIEPINLYHKVGIGSLDMYILNPVSDSKELKDFYQQWNQRVAQFGSNQHLPLPNTLSVCALLVWRPSDPNDKITRIFFPGNAPQHKVIEGLEKLKSLDVLKHPSCTKSTLNAKPAKKAATPRPPLKSKVSPVTTPRNETPEKTKKEVKETASKTATAPKPKPPMQKVKKEEVNKKTMKGPEKEKIAAKTEKIAVKSEKIKVEKTPAKDKPTRTTPSKPTSITKTPVPKTATPSKNSASAAPSKNSTSSTPSKNSTPSKGSAKSSASSTPKAIASPLKAPEIKTEKPEEVKDLPPKESSPETVQATPDLVDFSSRDEPQPKQETEAVEQQLTEPNGFHEQIMDTASPSGEIIQPDAIEPVQSQQESPSPLSDVTPETLPEPMAPGMPCTTPAMGKEEMRELGIYDEDEDIEGDLDAQQETAEDNRVPHMFGGMADSMHEDLMGGFSAPSNAMQGSFHGDLMSGSMHESMFDSHKPFDGPVIVENGESNADDLTPEEETSEEIQPQALPEPVAYAPESYGQEPDIIPTIESKEETILEQISTPTIQEPDLLPVKQDSEKQEVANILDTPDEVENVLPEDDKIVDAEEKDTSRDLEKDKIIDPEQDTEEQSLEPVVVEEKETFETQPDTQCQPEIDSDEEFKEEPGREPQMESGMPKPEQLHEQISANLHQPDEYIDKAQGEQDLLERPLSPEPVEEEQEDLNDNTRQTDSIEQSFGIGSSELKQAALNNFENIENDFDADEAEATKSPVIEEQKTGENDFEAEATKSPVIEEPKAGENDFEAGVPESPVTEEQKTGDNDFEAEGSETPVTEELKAGENDLEAEVPETPLTEDQDANIGAKQEEESVEQAHIDELQEQDVHETPKFGEHEPEDTDDDRAESPDSQLGSQDLNRDSLERDVMAKEQCSDEEHVQRDSIERDSEERDSIEKDSEEKMPERDSEERDSIEKERQTEKIIDPAEQRESLERSYEDDSEETEETDDEEEEDEEESSFDQDENTDEKCLIDEKEGVKADHKSADYQMDQPTDSLQSPESEYTDASHGGQVGYHQMDEQDGDSVDDLDDKQMSPMNQQPRPFRDEYEKYGAPSHPSGPMSSNPFEASAPGTNPFDGYGQPQQPQNTFDDSPDDDNINGGPTNFDPLSQWGQPMGLPFPAPPGENNPAAASSKLPASKPDSKKPGSANTKRPTSAAKPTASNGVPEKSKSGNLNSSKMTTGGSTNSSRLSMGGKTSKSRPLSAPIKSPSDDKSKANGIKRPATATGSKATSVSNKMPTLPAFTPFYVDLTYIPAHGNPNYSDIEFFKRVRARHYVLSALSPNTQILDALLEGKNTWEDKTLPVTIIPTYDNETLRLWMSLHKEKLADAKVEIAPSANRCTIQLQDHETSCSAYRLEF